MVSFVIGGSSGIGFETIKLLLREGYIVYNGSRRKCIDERVINIFVDVSKPETIKDAVEEITKTNSTIDLLVYNAGFSMASPIEFVEKDDYKYLFDVNVFGVIEVIKNVVPLMRRNGGGRIINVSSLGGVVPIPYDAYYSASKAAIDMLVFSLRSELSKYNILITNILPGGTITDFTFKRKVYHIDENNDYSDMKEAVNKLAEIEQNGMNARSVAKTILRVASCKNPPVLVPSGIKNKFIYLASQIIPKKIILKMTENKFKLSSKKEKKE